MSNKGRFGGFRKGKKIAKQIIQDQGLGQPASINEIDYSQFPGIWNLKSTVQFNKKLSSVSYFSSAFVGGSETTFYAVMPSYIKPGSLALLFVGTNNNVAQTTPTGWTLIGNATAAPRIYSYYKILEASDAGQTVSIPSASSSFTSGIIIFQGSPRISNVTAYDYLAKQSASAIGTTTINCSQSKGLTLVLSVLVGNPTGQTPTLTMSDNDQIISGYGAGLTTGNIRIGYKIFDPSNTNRSNITHSCNDGGSQALTGFYLELS